MCTCAYLCLQVRLCMEGNPASVLFLGFLSPVVFAGLIIVRVGMTDQSAFLGKFALVWACAECEMTVPGVRSLGQGGVEVPVEGLWGIGVQGPGVAEHI